MIRRCRKKAAKRRVMKRKKKVMKRIWMKRVWMKAYNSVFQTIKAFAASAGAFIML